MLNIGLDKGLFVWYCIGMNQINRLLKVNADILAQRELLRTETCPNVILCVALALKENERWLAEWEAQDRLARKNN